MGRTSTAKERLIENTAELLYEYGYNSLGINMMCDKSGVKKGSFFHFFPSKRDLILNVIDHQWEFYRVYVLEKAFEKDVTPLNRIRRFFKMTEELQASAKEKRGKAIGCFFGNLGLELSSQDEVVRNKLQEIFNKTVKHIQDVLTEAVAAGEVSSINTTSVAKSIHAYLEGVLVISKTYNDSAIIGQLTEGAIHLAVSAEEMKI